MFVVDPATADAIHQTFNEDGELAAIVEFRRHYPLLANNEHARTCVHTIAGWQPIALPPSPPSRRRAKKPCPEIAMQD
ncbi:MAG: hypothetical protein ACRYHQ_05860 [Janthinobacterium lividum]